MTHQSSDGQNNVRSYRLPEGVPFSLLRALSRGLYRRVTNIDEWLWHRTSFIFLPLFHLMHALVQHPFVQWVQVHLNNWLFDASSRWCYYAQGIAAIGTWLHSRVFWLVLQFYCALRQVWLTWLLSTLRVAWMASLLDQGQDKCSSILAGKELSLPWELLRLGCTLTRFAASGCNALFVLLSLPIALPLALPVAIWKVRLVVVRGVLWWVDAFVNLFDVLILRAWYFVGSKLLANVIDASIWIWLVILFPLWRLFLNLFSLMTYALMATFSVAAYLLALVVGAILQVVTILVKVSCAPITWMVDWLQL